MTSRLSPRILSQGLLGGVPGGAGVGELRTLVFRGLGPRKTAFGVLRIPRPVLLLGVWLLGFSCGVPETPHREKSPFSFEKTFTLKAGREVRFLVWGPLDQGQLLRLDRLGPQGPYQGQVTSLEAPLYKIETGDLDQDGNQEIYLWSLTGMGSYSHLTVLEENPQGWSSLGFPSGALTPGNPAYQGYRGKDELVFTPTQIIRRFPVYAPEDPMAAPSLGWRELAYGLENKTFVLQGQREGR